MYSLGLFIPDLHIVRPILQIRVNPLQRRTRYPKHRPQTIYQYRVIDGVESSRKVKADQHCCALTVNYSMEIIHDLDKRCLGAVQLPVRRLQWVKITQGRNMWEHPSQTQSLHKLRYGAQV